MEKRIIQRLLAAYVFVFCITLATPSHAFFTFLVQAIAAAAGVSLVTAAVIVIGGAFVLNAVTGGALFGNKRGSRAGALQNQSIMVNKNSSNEYIPVVYGKTRIGGTRVFVETSDGSGDATKSNYLNIVLAMCEGQMGNIQRLYFNDTIIWDSTEEGTLTGDAINGYTLENFRPKTIGEGEDAVEVNKYNGKVSAQYFPGHPDQAVSDLIQGSVSSDIWSDDHKLRGVVYIALKLQYDQDAFAGSVPTITAEIAGKVMVDVNATTDFANPVYVTPSANQNPVDVLYDLLTDADYGKGLSYTDIDTASFKTAWTHANGLYKIDGYLDTTEKLYDNVVELLDVFNGMLTYIDGKYKLRIRKQGETAVHNIGYDDIMDVVSVTRNTKEKHYNKITTTYRDPTHDKDNDENNYMYNENVIVIENAAYQTEDNSVLETEYENLMVSDTTLLTKLANYKLDASRHQTTLNFTGSHRLMNIEPGEIVNITVSELGYSNKPFRVLSMSITNENTVEFTCIEYISSVEIA